MVTESLILKTGRAWVAYHIGMRALRRSDNSARLEMTPLIDVVFLLLTFFIFSWFMMVRAEVLPVQILPIAGGQQPNVAQMQIIMIDAQGEFVLNRERVSGDQLAERLTQMALDPDNPSLFISVAEQGDLDRAPKLVELLERVRAAGLRNVTVVGRPDSQRTAPPAP